jgi:hypothetical protein
MVYVGVGGSASIHGAGDANCRASDSTRGMLEGKLSNWSLVLFGGGIRHVVALSGNNASHLNFFSSAASRGSSGMGGDGGGGAKARQDLRSLRSMATMHVASSAGGKRRRMRVGGNGTFGSISNKRRKRILNRILIEKRHESDRTSKSRDITIHDGGERKSDDASSEQNADQQQQQKPWDKKADFKCMNSYYPLQASAAAWFFLNFFTTHIAGHQFNSRKSALPPAVTYCLRGGEYKDPITPPCGILLRLSADTLFPAI